MLQANDLKRRQLKVERMTREEFLRSIVMFSSILTIRLYFLIYKKRFKGKGKLRYIHYLRNVRFHLVFVCQKKSASKSKASRYEIKLATKKLQPQHKTQPKLMTKGEMGSSLLLCQTTPIK